MKNKPILCLDFDGVIHSYTSGWKGARNIPDDPMPGAFEFISEALDYFEVAIFSSRSNHWGGRRAMPPSIPMNAPSARDEIARLTKQRDEARADVYRLNRYCDSYAERVKELEKRCRAVKIERDSIRIAAID